MVCASLTMAAAVALGLSRETPSQMQITSISAMMPRATPSPTRSPFSSMNCFRSIFLAMWRSSGKPRDGGLALSPN
jgi:hypothetical protein